MGCEASPTESQPGTQESFRVGPNGSQISLSDGAVLSIPEGALSKEITIQLDSVAPSTLTAALSSETTLVGQAHRFLPHGTQFLEPIEVILPYQGAANRVLRLDDESDTTWEVVPDAVFSEGRARFQTSSFSIYAVAQVNGNSIAKCDAPANGTPGTVSYTGGTFSAVDAVAVVTHLKDIGTIWGEHPFRTHLEIRLTDYANACGHEISGLDVQDSRWFQITLMTPSQVDYPALPPPGTYPFTSDQMDWETPSLRVAAEFVACDAQCGACSSVMKSTPTGSLTLTSVTETAVEGTFQLVVHGAERDETISGSFTAPICVQAESVQERCCVVDGSDDPDSDGEGTTLTQNGATLTLPAGTLTQSVEIGIETLDEEALSAELPEQTHLISDLYKITPTEILLAGTATLALPINASDTNVERKVIHLDNEMDTEWAVLGILGGSASYEGSDGAIRLSAVETYADGEGAGENGFGTIQGGMARFPIDRFGIYAIVEGANLSPSCDALDPEAATGNSDATGDFQNGKSWAAVDAAASVSTSEINSGISSDGESKLGGNLLSESELGDGGSQVTPVYTRTLQISVTDFPNACALQEAGYVQVDGTLVSLSLQARSTEGTPTLPAPGEYTITGYHEEWPTDGTYVAMAQFGWAVSGESECGYASVFLETPPTGTVTLSEVSQTMVKGNFAFQDEMGSYEGSFEAPVCANYEARCCHVTK